MAYNQFLTAELKGTTLEVTGRTPEGQPEDPPVILHEIAVAVGALEPGCVLPKAGGALPQDIISKRALSSPWTAFFNDLPEGFESGDTIMVIGTARGEFPGGPVEIWYEKVPVK